MSFWQKNVFFCCTSIPTTVNIKPFIPHLALQPYVLGYAFVELEELITKQNPVHIFPVEYTVICFALDEQKLIKELHTNETTTHPFCYVGFLNKFRSFETFTKRLVQIYLKPYGGYKLLGIPQHHFINCATNVEAIFPNLNVMVNQMQDNAGSPEKVVGILDKWLLQRLEQTKKIYVDRMAYACNLIQASAGNMSIPELCTKAAMSPTTLRDHFKEKIGFGPKTFSRIVRFNQMNRFLCNHSDTKWTQLVDEFQFFDQNHFIKEFKYFFGCTPSQLHKIGELSFTGQLLENLDIH